MLEKFVVLNLEYQLKLKAKPFPGKLQISVAMRLSESAQDMRLPLATQAYGGEWRQ